MNASETRRVIAQLENVHGMIRALPEGLNHERRMLAEPVATVIRTLRTNLEHAETEAAALGEPAPILTVGGEL
jgi:hypothetical protein